MTSVFPSSAEREGAFRLRESGDVSGDAVVAAAMAAGAKRCQGERIVYVPVDGTSLTLTDYSGRRELGRVGMRFFARGLQVMSALAGDVNGGAIVHSAIVMPAWYQLVPSVCLTLPRPTCSARFAHRRLHSWPTRASTAESAASDTRTPMMSDRNSSALRRLRW